MSGAKTLTLDSKTNHVPLIGAEFLTTRRPRRHRRRRPRPARTMVPDSFSIRRVGK
jgi:hypothetical protein